MNVEFTINNNITGVDSAFKDKYELEDKDEQESRVIHIETIRASLQNDNNQDQSIGSIGDNPFMNDLEDLQSEYPETFKNLHPSQQEQLRDIMPGGDYAFTKEDYAAEKAEKARQQSEDPSLVSPSIL